MQRGIDGYTGDSLCREVSNDVLEIHMCRKV